MERRAQGAQLETLGVRIDPTTLSRIDVLKAREDRTRSSCIKRLLREAVAVRERFGEHAPGCSLHFGDGLFCSCGTWPWGS